LTFAMLLAGRFLVSALFVVAGIRHFFLIEPLTSAIGARGLPYPKAILIAGSLFQLVFGLLLMAGVQVTAAAIGLILFTIAASVMLLNFWDMQGPQRRGAINGCLANVAVIGGLLMAGAATF